VARSRKLRQIVEIVRALQAFPARRSIFFANCEMPKCGAGLGLV
jgi:hypothetical protein